MHKQKTVWALIVLLALAMSCDRQSAPADHTDAGEVTPAVEAGPDHAAHEGHEEGEAGEPSDLDRPVDELFAAECEHNMKTFACEECRYEVGVVRAPKELFTEGLLHLGKVEQKTVDLPILLTGEVVFDESRVSHIGTTVPGVVRKVNVILGEHVSRGQVLVELESGEAGEAQEAFLAAEAELQLATREFARMEELYKQRITSEKEYLRAQKDVESARIRVGTSQGRLTLMGLDAAVTRALKPEDPRGRIPIRAPEAGSVLTLHAVPGEIAHPEESLATLGDNSVLWIWCDLYEQDIAAFTTAAPTAQRRVLVSVKAWPGQEFPGTVDFISPSLNPGTRTARVRITVQNHERRLMAGMFAQVQVFLPGSETVAALPRNAVCEDEGHAFVFVPHHEDYFVRREVVTGRTWADRIEVLEAPADLAAVVTDGVFLLKSDVLRSKMGAGCAD
jgi:cobalt-zinc-cadmium efflux system membrane fusion protein